MKISELVDTLNHYKQKYGDLQIAVYNDEFFQHDSSVDISLAEKEKDVSSPFPKDDSLNDTFLSIRSL